MSRRSSFFPPTPVRQLPLGRWRTGRLCRGRSPTVAFMTRGRRRMRSHRSGLHRSEVVTTVRACSCRTASPRADGRTTPYARFTTAHLQLWLHDLRSLGKRSSRRKIRKKHGIGGRAPRIGVYVHRATAPGANCENRKWSATSHWCGDEALDHHARPRVRRSPLRLRGADDHHALKVPSTAG